MSKILEAKEELKRADHLLYVSLKYTRTVDVIKSIIDRLIASIDLSMDFLLEIAKEKKRLKEEIPTNVGLKAELLQRVYEDPRLAEMIVFFITLRKINRAEYKRSNEFRRHVTMTAITESGIILINLDVIKEYYERTVDYVKYSDELINPKKEH